MMTNDTLYYLVNVFFISIIMILSCGIFLTFIDMITDTSWFNKLKEDHKDDFD